MDWEEWPVLQVSRNEQESRISSAFKLTPSRKNTIVFQSPFWIHLEEIKI